MLQILAVSLIASVIPWPVAKALYTPRGIGSFNETQSFNLPLSLQSNDSVILDYGALVVGFPVLQFANASGSYVELELKYSEGYPGILLKDGDGPYNFASALANNFRTETINVTDVIANNGSHWESYFNQGAFRWQSLRLTQGSSLTIKNLGFRSTAATTSKQDESGDATLQDLNSTFSCSNELYNRIWNLGPKAAEIACTRGPGSLPSTWEIDQENGAYIRGQHAARSANLTGVLPSPGYTLKFQAKIDRVGFGFVLDAGITGWGPSFYVVGGLSSDTTYSTHDSELLPANTLTIGDGFALVNQTTQPGVVLERYPISSSVDLTPGQWINVSASSFEEQVYNVSLNGQQIASVNISSLPGYLGPSPFYLGELSVGLGGWQNLDAHYRNVELEALNGTSVYFNSMTGNEVLAEYGVLPNSYEQCLDGGKRDRLVWLGDFYITSTTLAVSTQNFAAWRGTLRSVFDLIGAYGGVGMNNPMGTAKKYAAATADSSFVSELWSNVKTQIQFSLSWVAPDTQLWGPPAVFRGVTNGTAPSSYLVETLRNMADLAHALEDHSLGMNYSTQANNTAAAVQSLLYNTTEGVYVSSASSGGAFTYSDIAFSIRAGIGSANQTASQLQALNSLQGQVGYGAVATPGTTDYSTQVSPFLSGFLLEALGQVNATEQINFLLNSVWSYMAKEGPYYTGASWEYVDTSGQPGLGNFTSLSHPWASGPTSTLTRYGLGLRPISAGYKKWTLAPVDLGLEYANGTLQTPQGSIVASWSKQGSNQEGEGANNGNNSKLELIVQAPSGTTGLIVPFMNGNYTVNGSEDSTTSIFPIEVHGGSRIVIKQV